jgi:hypothetical protein
MWNTKTKVNIHLKNERQEGKTGSTWGEYQYKGVG